MSDKAPFGSDNGWYAKYFVIQLAMWWFFSTIYSIEVKNFLLENPSLALEASFVSLFLTFVCSLALMRRDDLASSMNLFSIKSFQDLFLPSLLHLIGTISTNYSVSLMAISFTHVVKAVEPVFTIVWSLLLASKGVAKMDDIGLEKIVIIGMIILGVIISSINEVTFSWLGLIFGMISNLSFSGRNVLFKHSMSGTKVGKDSLYLVLNLFGAIVSFILVLLFGDSEILHLDSYSRNALFSSGLSYFLYTTISIRILEGVSPLTHAISNTCKRLVVVFVSTLYFSQAFTTMSTFGASITIGGVAMYSLYDKNKRRSSYYVKVTAFVVFAFVAIALAFGKFSNDDSGKVIFQKLPLSISSLSNSTQHIMPHQNVRSDSVTLPHTTIIQGLQEQILRELTPEFEGKTEIAILCHPDYRNRGDSAIYIGEVVFVHHIGLKLVYECSCGGPGYCDINKLRALDPKKTVMAHHGGGNFGDIWTDIDRHRRGFIDQLAEYQHFLFPQSIYYGNTNNTIPAAQLFETKNITLSARDTPSYEILEEFFTNTKRLLVPDMAFMIGAIERQEPKVDILWILRLDKESLFPQDMRLGKLVDLLPKKLRMKITMSYGDWENEDVVGLTGNLTNHALMRFNDACSRLSEGRVVISDRLHSHIISTLLGIPHVMLDNHYGKVKNCHTEWTPKLENVASATTLEEAVRKAVDLLAIEKNTKYEWV
eukprot:TRINITY_DN1181_c0_g1_i2.p1 TRINITY_DN1181_c0_g1~~TRINITY_DN1181_c0_g1_i2.p1  ORF type:complete len:709 (-),score=89.46 TRINITY_DN1181_c0_g1_i2:1338-3464(-)